MTGKITTTIVKDFYGKIIGYIEEDKLGNKTVKDFYKVVLGYYKKNMNATTDFYGKILARGDIASSLLYSHQKQGK